jgi:hypothetical protein
MTPERYREVGQVFRAAADIPPDRRAAFLDAACGDDKALRQMSSRSSFMFHKLKVGSMAGRWTSRRKR